MIIAIDFDGTIVENEFPKIGPLRRNAKKVINKLYDQGHSIIVWTCRTSQDDFGTHGEASIFHVKEFLDENGVKFHTLNNNVSDAPFQPSPKVYADVYIDDKQLGGLPDDWEEIYETLLEYHHINVK